MDSLREMIEQAVEENQIVIFIKGPEDNPSCGFSARAIEALRNSGVSFVAVDVLEEPRMRQELSSLYNWPTIPQLFVAGRLIGGADVISGLEESGRLGAILAGAPPDEEELSWP